ncbi:MAG: methyltransferase [Nocardioidaceae bacterium]
MRPTRRATGCSPSAHPRAGDSWPIWSRLSVPATPRRGTCWAARSGTTTPSIPEEGAEFSRAMGEVASYTSEVVAGAVDPAEQGTILDLGGAHGDLLTGLLQRAPHASGVLFDLPQVIDRARRRVEGSPASDRLHLVGGDFFETVPSADVYVLMRILHDWDDAEAHRILAACRRDAPTTARMLIVETLVPDPWAPSPAHLFDLAMLVLQGGREPTEPEYRALLAGAGWRLRSVSSTSTAYTLLEATAG